MKLKKKSGLIGVVVALSAASLVSVGFASWVISQGTDATATGTIYVDEVSDQRHVVTATWVSDSTGASALGSNPVVSYGPKSNTPGTGDWLTDTTGTIEALTFYLKVKITNVNSDANFDAAIDSFAMTADAGYATAATANYVGSLPALNATAGNGVGTIVKGTGAASGTDWEAVYTITFAWGSHFNYLNPQTYYNGKTITATLPESTTTYGDDAVASLSALKTALNNVTFTITIVTK